ncbi:MAG: hypothetical protein LLG42_04035 [Chloroflexi bacterium]|nr:hypothetical protein [Chloroflexota bacterium]
MYHGFTRRQGGNNYRGRTGHWKRDCPSNGQRRRIDCCSGI